MQHLLEQIKSDISHGKLLTSLLKNLSETFTHYDIQLELFYYCYISKCFVFYVNSRKSNLR